MTNVNGTPSRDSSSDVRGNLTPAANELIDRIVQEYRNRLILEARRSIGSGKADSIVRVADVQFAEVAIAQSSSKESKLLSLLRGSVDPVYLVIGSFAVGVVMTISVFAADGRDSARSPLATWIATIGLAIGVLIVSYFVLRAGIRSNIIDVSDFIMEVANLERRARKSASQLNGLPPEGQSLSKVLQTLTARRIWSPKDLLAFRDVMALRNQFAYEERPRESSEEMLDALREVRRLKDTLKNIEIDSVGDTSAPASDASALELDVYQTLVGEGFSVDRVADKRADFLVEISDVTVAVLVKRRHGRRIELRDVHEWLSLEDNSNRSLQQSTLLVVDGELSRELIDLGSIQIESDHRPVRLVRIVHWDDDVTVSTRRLLHSLGYVVQHEIEAAKPPGKTSDRSGRFEIYTDRTGKFRFRLKAPDGLVIATSEAFESKSAALSSIERVRRSSIAADVQDRTM